MIELDHKLFDVINGFVGTWAWLDSLMTLLVSDFFLPVVISAAVWSLWFTGETGEQRFGKQMGFIYAAGGAALSNWLIQIINLFADRSRPFLALPETNVLFYRPTDPSFPSNAAAFAFAMAAGVWLVDRRLGLTIGAAAFVFSFGRVYAGMHYPLDVVGGALIGVLVTYAFFRVLGLLQPLVNVAFRVARFFYLA